MKKLANKKLGGFTVPRVHGQIKRQFKKEFNKRITTKEINKIWVSYIEEEVINNLRKGIVVDLAHNMRVWVKARKRTEDKRAMVLLEKGLMYSGGRIVPLNINISTTKYIYDIVFEIKNYKHKNKIYFQPHRDLSKAVNEGILQGKLITREYVN